MVLALADQLDACKPALCRCANQNPGLGVLPHHSKVFIEVVVWLVFTALVGIAARILCAVAIAPFLWRLVHPSSDLLEQTTKVSVVLVVFFVSWFELTTLIQWSNRGVRFTTALLIAHFLFFVVGLCVPRLRREIVTSLEGVREGRLTRSIVRRP